MSVGFAQIRVVLIALLLGSATTPILKGLYEITAPTPSGEMKFFEKPLFLTFVMFFGMALVLPIHFYVEKTAHGDDGVQGAAGSASSSEVELAGISSQQNREREPLLPKTSTAPAPAAGLTKSEIDNAPPAIAKLLHKSGSTPSLDPNDPFGDQASTSTRGSAQLPQSATYNSQTVLTPQQQQQQQCAAVGYNGPDFSKLSILFDWKLNVTLLIPSAFDLLGSALSTIGLLYTSMSVYQLFRCSVIIVTAFLKRFVLKHHLTTSMWVGIALNMLAMMLVASTAFFDSAATPEGESVTKPGVPHGNQAIGLAFIFASCLVQGAQYVFEEKVMSHDSIPPLYLVGMEGVWGMILSILVVFPVAGMLPGSDNGVYEDVSEAWFMVRHRTALQLLLVIFTVLLSFYNVACIYVTFVANSIWHAIMDNCRPIAVWLISLGLYYTTGRVGEPWRMTSWLELAGIVVLVYGTAVYSGHVKFPGIPEEGVVEEAEPEQALIRDSFRDPMPATPRFAARGSPRVSPVATVEPTGSITQMLHTLNQSPRFGPSHPPYGHSHSHGQPAHGHSHAHGPSSHTYGAV